jgi:hypothetical protein
VEVQRRRESNNNNNKVTRETDISGEDLFVYYEESKLTNNHRKLIDNLHKKHNDHWQTNLRKYGKNGREA